MKENSRISFAPVNFSIAKYEVERFKSEKNVDNSGWGRVRLEPDYILLMLEDIQKEVQALDVEIKDVASLEKTLDAVEKGKIEFCIYRIVGDKKDFRIIGGVDLSEPQRIVREYNRQRESPTISEARKRKMKDLREYLRE